MDIEIKILKISNITDMEIEEVVNVYNKSFGIHPASVIRDKDIWIWRYKKRPSSDNDIVIVAKNKNKAVGCVVLTFYPVKIEDKVYNFGMIDDVSVVPEYAGKGIARKMLNYAIDYAKEKKCFASALYADPKYIAIKLYRKLGYQDINQVRNFIYPANFWNLFSSIPLLLPILPVFGLWYALGRIILEIRCLKKNIKVEKIKEEEIENFIHALNKSHSKFFGFYPASRDYFQWKYFNIPKNYKTIILVAKEKNKIVGGISLITQKARFKNNEIMHCFINEFFYSKKQVAFYLIKEMLKYSSNIKLPISAFLCNEKDRETMHILKSILSLPVGKGTFMINLFSNVSYLQYSSFTWHVINESAVGIP